MALTDYSYYPDENDIDSLGVILNPKTLKPYAVCSVYDEEEATTYVIITNIVESVSARWEDLIGAGYFDDDVGVRGESRFQRNPRRRRRRRKPQFVPDNYLTTPPSDYRHCLRVHTPDGVMVAGQGLGFVLYGGMCLAAAVSHGSTERSEFDGYYPGHYINVSGGAHMTDEFDPCIYSVEGYRSSSADNWWEAQVTRDLVDAYEYCETGLVGITKKDLAPLQERAHRKAVRAINKQIREIAATRPCTTCGRSGKNYDTKCKNGRCKDLKLLHLRKQNITIKPKLQYSSCVPGGYQILPIDNLLQTGTVLSAHYLNYRFSEQHVPAWGLTYDSDVNVALQYIPDAMTLLSMDLIDVNERSFVDYVVELALAKDPSVKAQAKKFSDYWSEDRLYYILNAKLGYLIRMEDAIAETLNAPAMRKHIKRIDRFAEEHLAATLFESHTEPGVRKKIAQAQKAFDALGRAILSSIAELEWEEEFLAPLSAATKQHWFAIALKRFTSSYTCWAHFKTEFTDDVAEMMEQMFLGK